MKRLPGLLLAAAFMALSALTSYAGTFTQQSPSGTADGRTYYIGDSGTYMKSCWVYVDGIWYWLTADGSLPTAYGISADGYIFNEKGIYVPSSTGNAAQAAQAGGAGQVQSVTQHAAANGSAAAYRHTGSSSDYGPGAGGVSDPRDDDYYWNRYEWDPNLNRWVRRY